VNGDLVARLGPLALATRLRRLAEMLYRDGPRIYDDAGVDFEPRWFPLYHLLLEATAPVTVSLAAKALGQRHPAIVQIAREMCRRGMLVSTADRKDRRKTMLRLTPKGRAALTGLRPVWADIEAVARELLREAGGDFLARVTRIENALSRAGVYQRVRQRVRARQLAQVKIISYSRSLRRRFESLNSEWLQEYYRVERPDREVLRDPCRKIIEPGGCVLFARIGRTIVGTVALVKHSEHTFELTKMAVARPWRRRQAGRRLALAAIDQARARGARRVVLLTSRRLAAAYQLYRSLGFHPVPDLPQWAAAYKREALCLALELSANHVHRAKNED